MLLTPFITQPFNAPVWRMQIDPVTDTIFLELRNNADKRVSFAGVNLHTGAVNFNNMTLPERWLTGIEAAYNGVLLLHGYQTESAPIHKGLTGISGSTGEILWTDYNSTFDELTLAGPLVYDTRIQPKKPYLIDIQTGIRVQAEVTIEEINNHISVPRIADPAMLPVELQILQAFGNEVHYLKHNNFRIVSLHALIGSLLKQHLHVFNTSAKLVFEDIINEDIQKLQPEAFITYKNKLIWLQNRSVLKVLNL